MKKNDILFLRAEKLGADLEGICRHEGMPVFVPGMLPGETASVRIVKTEKKYAFGRLETFPSDLSPDRRKPDCPSYPRCGGCTARHFQYEATLAAKRDQVEDCLQRIGGISVPVLPVMGMEDPSHYRNKTSLPVSGTADDPVLGFYAPRSHAVVPVASCPNAMEPANGIAAAVLSWMRKHRLAPYQETSHTGLVRHLVIRVNRRGESMVTLVANASSLPGMRELGESLSAMGVVSLYLNENRQRNNVILSNTFHLISGRETLTETLFDLRFELSPASFFQINPVQTEKLYQVAADFADLKPHELLADVYCGAGTITLTLASRCRRAIGIEIVPQAVENARRNAAANGIHNVEFHAGKAEDLLPRFVEDGLRPDVILIDPPRKGVEPPVIQAIAQAQPSRVVYISCNPATLARDVKLLAETGYQVMKVQPVDMFCWTSGIETVLLMSQQKPDDTIHVGIDLKPEDVTVAESKATYAELQAYIEEKYGFKVSNLYIAQAKAALGIKERENYNKPKNPDSKKLVCPPDKMAAIQEALRHFKMI